MSFLQMQNQNTFLKTRMRHELNILQFRMQNVFLKIMVRQRAYSFMLKIQNTEPSPFWFVIHLQHWKHIIEHPTGKI